MTAMHNEITAELYKTVALLEAVIADATLIDQTAQVAQQCADAFRAGHKILLAGNGGSAADSQHLAGEFACRFAFDRPGLPALALTTDGSVMTAICNDYQYDYVFARQLEGLGNEGDVFFAISTSGKSPNILRALEAARTKKLYCVGITGQSGGAMLELCDICLRIPSGETAKVQEAYKVLGHIICALVEKAMFGKQA